MKFIPAAMLAAMFSVSAVQAQTAAKSPAKSAPATKKAAARAAKPAALDKVALEAYIRHLLLWNDTIKVVVGDPKPAPMNGFHEVIVTGSAGDVSLDEPFYVSFDGSKIVRGSVYDVKQSPFTKELGMLKNTPDQPWLGTDGAPVTLVEFSDYQCAYCREEARILKANLLKTYPKEVKFYFREFPLDQIHPWARTAAVAGRCVLKAKREAFWDFHEWIFDKQKEITVENLKTKFMEWAQSKSLDQIQLGRCYDARATEGEIDRNVAEAKALRLNSTPTIFINGRMFPGSLPWTQMKTVIDWELNYSKKKAAEAEACCSLTLPVPAPKVK